MSNEIIDSIFEGAEDLFEEGEVEFAPNYVGKWPLAVLTDVNPLAKTEKFGFELQLSFNLKGDSVKYTGRIRLPRTIDASQIEPSKMEGAQKANDFTKNVFNTVAFAAGLLKAKERFGNIDSQDKYDRIVSAFRMRIGANVPIEIRPQQQRVPDPANPGKFKYVNHERFTTFSGLAKPKQA